jgi:hypothetical protein
VVLLVGAGSCLVDEVSPEGETTSDPGVPCCGV